MNSDAAIHGLGALAHDTRLRIFRLLVQRGPDGISAGAIAESVGVPPSSLSFHLAHLRRAGLILQRRDSRQLIYSADYARMTELMGYLTENCCGGNPAMCAPAGASQCVPRPAQRKLA